MGDVAKNGYDYFSVFIMIYNLVMLSFLKIYTNYDLSLNNKPLRRLLN